LIPIKTPHAGRTMLRLQHKRSRNPVFQHILIAYDGSKASERAFHVAVALAGAFKGRVRVVSVIGLPAAPIEAAPVVIEDQSAWIADALATLVSSVSRTTCPVDSEVAYGPPSDALLELAATHAVDHIVLGRTGKGAVERMLLGSVSHDIVHRAKVGVTLVP
jgi:nucleotide-binding universal stress UspA family protein